ncbi:MAG: hypothetical protein AAGL17_11895 [Cyanobacteria bacterium J06576_12]
MSGKNINAELQSKDLESIKASLKAVKAKMPFLIHLSTQERRRFLKMGDKSLAFVTNSLLAAQSNPEILPGNFDVASLNRDYQLSRDLLEVQTVLRQLNEQVDDTLLAVGSEAMTNSLSIYDYVKTAAKREPGLKGLAEQLGERFKKIRRRSSHQLQEA